MLSAELLPLLAMMLLTGVVGGVLAGLLGVGGGIVVVPVLEVALTILGVDADIRMHVAVATSLAIIVPTAIASARAHHARGAVDDSLFRLWSPFMFLGAAAGVLIAAAVHSSVLAGVFAVVALLVAVKMLLFPDLPPLRRDVPRSPAGRGWMPGAIGALSSMMGIGGGTLSVPVLTLCGQPIHKAVGTSALFGLVISVPAAIGFVLAGWDDARAPELSAGYVNLAGVLLIAPVSYLCAPLGVRLAHHLSQRQLSMAFGGFLLIVAVRMAFRAVSGA